MVIGKIEQINGLEDGFKLFRHERRIFRAQSETDYRTSVTQNRVENVRIKLVGILMRNYMTYLPMAYSSGVIETALD